MTVCFSLSRAIRFRRHAQQQTKHHYGFSALFTNTQDEDGLHGNTDLPDIGGAHMCLLQRVRSHQKRSIRRLLVWCTSGVGQGRFDMFRWVPVVTAGLIVNHEPQGLAEDCVKDGKKNLLHYPAGAVIPIMQLPPDDHS